MLFDGRKYFLRACERDTVDQIVDTSGIKRGGGGKKKKKKMREQGYRGES